MSKIWFKAFQDARWPKKISYTNVYTSNIDNGLQMNSTQVEIIKRR